MKHLLLLHGAIGAKDQLEPLAKMLKTNFVVHTLNFSGHGGKSMPDEFSIKLFADDVLDYLSTNKIAEISIFGYSMGGYVALFLARHHPDKINKVVTLATKFEWSPEIATRETKMLDSSKIAEKLPTFAKQLEMRHQLADWKDVLSKTAAMMHNLGADNPLKPEDFKNIQKPVLIGVGDKDAMVSLDETIAVFRILTDSNLIVYPGMQHPIERADVNRLASELIAFI